MLAPPPSRYLVMRKTVRQRTAARHAARVTDATKAGIYDAAEIEVEYAMETNEIFYIVLRRHTRPSGNYAAVPKARPAACQLRTGALSV